MSLPLGWVEPEYAHPVRRIAGRDVDFRRTIAVMAVVNRTPDSFYDRGATFGLDAAVAAGRRAVEQGAAWIDIDGNGPVPAFVPDNCVVIGGVAQYPENPNGNGYYPDPGTNEPWCVAAVDIHPVGNILQATETLLGSNDPNFQRS